MPKEITHWLIAQKTFLSLPEKSPLKSALSEHYNLYFTAAVLPDSPYYCLGPKCGKTGQAADHFHNQQGNYFAPLVAVLEAKPHLSFDAELCFTAGIITHIIADSVFHPVISTLNVQDSGKESTAGHRLLETGIDLLFMKEFARFEQRLLMTYMKGLEVHLDDLAAVLVLFFNLTGPQSGLLMKKSLRDHCLVQRLLDKKWAIWPLLLLNIFRPGLTADLLALSYAHAKRSPTVFGQHSTSHKNPIFLSPSAITMAQLKTKSVEIILEIFSLLATAGNRLELRNHLRNLTGPNLITGLPTCGSQRPTAKKLTTPPHDTNAATDE